MIVVERIGRAIIEEAIADLMEEGYFEKAFDGPEIAATTVSGIPSAELVGRYTLKTTAGGSFPVRSRLVVIPRGTHMFLVGMAAAADADAATTGELASIFDSLRLKSPSK